MKLARLASKLYPRWWRDRYGNEFDALLEDARPGLGGALDIAKGAVAVQLTSWTPLRTFAWSFLVGLVASAAAWAALPRPFESQAVLRLTGGGTAEQAMGQIIAVLPQTLSRTTLTGMVQQLSLYPDERRQLPVEDVIERMRRSIRIAPLASQASGDVYFSISFTYPEEKQALEVVSAISNLVMQANPRLDGSLGLVEKSTRRNTPNPAIIATGTSISVVIGGLVAWILRRRRVTAPGGTPPATSAT